jgi:hypothetical protein
MWVGGGGGGCTLPCPGGPKSHMTDENPIAAICVESQWSDFELLKCCCPGTLQLETIAGAQRHRCRMASG